MNEDERLDAHVAALLARAESGDTRAMFDLGCLFDLPEKPGIRSDLDQARAWYEQAAEGGHAWAQFALGNMLERAQGGSRNELAARQLYEASARQGVAEAQMHLARMLETGRGGPAAPAEAADWYARAAAQGHEVAATNLAIMHLEKTAPSPDVNKARDLLTFAADKLDGRAHLVLGDLYLTGRAGERHGALSLVHFSVAAMLLPEGEPRDRAIAARESLLARQPHLRKEFDGHAREFVATRRPDAGVPGNARSMDAGQAG